MKKISILLLLFLVGCHSMNRYWVELRGEDGQRTLVNKDKILSIKSVDEKRCQITYINGQSKIVIEPYKSLKKRLKNNFLYVK